MNSDRLILFNGPMVRANKDDRKTQTRRTITRLRRFGTVTEFGRSDTPGYDWHFRDAQARWHDLKDADLKKYLPYSVGDRLYVREAWRVGRKWNASKPRDLPARTMTVMFEAGGCICNVDRIGDWRPDDSPEYDKMPSWAGKLRPGMHMPRWASRLTLIVTDVRVQKLQDISEEDAVAEGVHDTGRRDGAPYQHFTVPGVQGIITEHDPISVFAQLWEHVNGAGAWKANPWVCAYTYTVHHCNIDALDLAEAEAS